jgi:hypothetical protein
VTETSAAARAPSTRIHAASASSEPCVSGSRLWSAKDPRPPTRTRASVSRSSYVLPNGRSRPLLWTVIGREVRSTLTIGAICAILSCHRRMVRRLLGNRSTESRGGTLRGRLRIKNLHR